MTSSFWMQGLFLPHAKSRNTSRSRDVRPHRSATSSQLKRGLRPLTAAH